ncbi:MAG: GIY-YIG nuclease family protein [Candidatus Heimdallarchaeota archaeon]|nr:GIY-YIG nuclease family protein [Candidatus Heimdallarchaeota archaeon]
MKFYVYMVICADGTIYTGYTQDIQKRIAQHNSSSQGSKYTRSRRPVKLAYVEILPSQNAAIKRERALKKLSHKQKVTLIEKYKIKEH